MCNKNINEILNVDFSNVNDEFNWINDGTNAIQTVSGQLVLKPSSGLNTFRRSLGQIDPTNNRLNIIYVTEKGKFE